ncbi:MAG: UDP-N-acetylmuramate dehydrogenase [Bacteroidetes bacterium]|nr:UDP-N-acetylmuramate dehydrogenase [Bacteroidota bacterium]
MTIQENFSLLSYNTFGVKVNARYFAVVQSLEDLQSAILFAKENNLPLLFLGGGSNILFAQDFAGLVVQLNLKGIAIVSQGEDEVLISAQAGENWHEFVQYCLRNNYGGLENLSLIPGNVGTSPIQNIGAYGVEIKDVFHSCTVLHLSTFALETFTLPQCNFGYRDSVFKNVGKGKYVIMEVTYRLTKNNHAIRVDYGAIQNELAKMGVGTPPSIQEVSRAVVAIRESKLPNPKLIGNAGSFFKNPTVDIQFFNDLKLRFPTISGYANEKGVKIAAGWLIEQAGWKGKQIGNVACHHLQALVIINKTGRASGKEIYDFSEKIIQSVKEKFSIVLEREVNIV